jgi:ribosome silencing factor RsfS/YbeB/iojap/nicotinate (nicotinamide) nucleotide adenylyltransferase
LKRLHLNEVWWLVSPQNPLKPAAGMAPFAERLNQARRFAVGHRRIRVTDLENRLDGRHYTADTLQALRRRFPQIRFVWLMGGDNLIQIRHWQRWTEIFETVPIAVFDRPSYSLEALASLAARRFARSRVPAGVARRLAETKPPAWVFFHDQLDPSSATRIRAERNREQPPLTTEQKPELATITSLRSCSQGPRIHSARPVELLDLVLKALEDGKAEDILTIDLAGKTAIADFMVVASGRTGRQVAALTEHVEQALSRRAQIAIEGKAQGDWVLIDAVDVIVHLFRPEIRAYYNLEKLWSEAFPDAEAARQ